MNASNALNAAFTLALATASLADDGPATSPDRELPPHITRLTLFGEPPTSRTMASGSSSWRRPSEMSTKSTWRRSSLA